MADEFNGPELAPGWEWYVPQSGPTYSLTAVPGSLRMSLPAEQSFEHWGQDDSAPQLRRTDMGNQDWNIETRLENINAAQNAGYWAALEVGFGQYDQLWYGMVDDGYLKEGRVGDCCSSFEFYESLPISLRLEKHGEEYTFFYKHDADVVWTEINTQTYSGTPTYIGLIGRSWDTGSSDLEIDWSYFRLERTEAPVVEPQDVVVTVLDTSGNPQAGLNTYVFDNTTYTGQHGVTDENGEITFRLSQGSYRFRADLNGTYFWSGNTNHCDIPDCDNADIKVTKPVTVTVLNTDDELQAGLKVYAFNGTIYTSYNATTNAGGQANFTLPEGTYRFRVDLNGTHFWSGTGNHCDVPGCDSADITVTKPVTIWVNDGSGLANVNVYAFEVVNPSTDPELIYSGYHSITNVSGEAVFTLPQGNYRFRADYTAPDAGNSVQFWNNSPETCSIPGCTDLDISITNAVTVTVLDTNLLFKEGLKVYAFNGNIYTGYHGTTNENGQAIFTLPFGAYRFRADFNDTQFWSGTTNHCDIPDCGDVSITVTKPITVTVLNTDDVPQAGLNVYAFDESAYTGYHLITNASGQVIFTLPQGSYRFRADFNGTQFWSEAATHCDLPGCDSTSVTVTNGVLVTVEDTDGTPETGLKVYAYNGTTYTGFSATTNANGQVTLTLPQGSYRFRADLNGTQFWSEAANHCDIPICGNAGITVAKPVIVTVLNTDNASQAGLKVYAYNGATYTGYSATTNANGQVTFTLPLGSYRFRADLNGTQFWSGAGNSCNIPDCGSMSVTVAKPITVTVLNTDNAIQAGLKVYAYNGTTYTGYSATTNESGQVTLTLPLGSYRFRADLNGVQFWSGTSNHCTLPGCESAQVTVTIPVIVTVQNGLGVAKSGVTVYAFNGTIYTGYSKVTNTNGQVVFTLPLGNYRFRADYNSTQFWSSATNQCTLPGCLTAVVTVTP